MEFFFKILSLAFGFLYFSMSQPIVKLCIHSFLQQIFFEYLCAGTVPGTKDTAVNKTDKWYSLSRGL